MAEAEAQESVEAVETEESTTSQQNSDQTQEHQQEQKSTSIAEGGEAKVQEQEKPYWPEDWREKAAKHASAGDEKAYKKELRRLERFTDPSAIYGWGRELESKFSEGGLIKKPGKDASDEDKAAYYKAIGVPEKPEGYLENLQLANGLVLGENDKPMVQAFAEVMHKVGATPEVVSQALNWHFANQEEVLAKSEEQDEQFRRESEQSLKEEYGAAYRRNVNNIANVFRSAPGGADASNEESLYARLMSGYTGDGVKIGNDPDMVRWLVSLAQEINPMGAVMDETSPGAKTVEDEIKEIQNTMRTDRRSYNKNPAMQARYKELLSAQEKMQARAS